MKCHCIRDPTLRPPPTHPYAGCGGGPGARDADSSLHGGLPCRPRHLRRWICRTTPVSGTFLSHSLPPLLSSHLRSRSTHVQTIDRASRGKGQQLARHSGGYLAMEWSSKLLVLLPGRAGVVGIGAHAARGAAPPRTRSWVCVSCRSLALASNQLFGYRSGEEIVLTPAD